MHYILGILFLIFVIVMAIQYWYVILAIGILCALPFIIRHIRMRLYFASEEFLSHKSQISAVVGEHNEVASYATEIRESGSFELGVSRTGTHAHLAEFEN